MDAEKFVGCAAVGDGDAFDDSAPATAELVGDEEGECPVEFSSLCDGLVEIGGTPSGREDFLELNFDIQPDRFFSDRFSDSCDCSSSEGGDGCSRRTSPSLCASRSTQSASTYRGMSGLFSRWNLYIVSNKNK